jgi:hypothetical protein
MTICLRPLSPQNYTAHPLHSTDRVWVETNCYIDAWVEVLNAFGFDPIAAGACTLSADFEAGQWRFLKFPLDDLRALFGIEVNEMNLWRGVLDHLAAELAAGRLLTVEVDAWWLPDTDGVSYRKQHVKTTIIPQLLDRQSHRLGYFHGPGYFELSGDDFEGVFRLGAFADDDALPPYVELVRFDRRVSSDGLATRAAGLARSHLARRPEDNPVQRLAERLRADVPWLASQDLDTFHLYAFGVLRQCGATAELAADFVDWLTDQGVAELRSASAHFRSVATGAKTLQFQVARLTRGRGVDVEPLLDQLVVGWAAAMAELDAWSRT